MVIYKLEYIVEGEGRKKLEKAFYMWVLRKEKKGERDGFGLKPQQESDSFSFVCYYLLVISLIWFTQCLCHHVLLSSHNESPLYKANKRCLNDDDKLHKQCFSFGFLVEVVMLIPY
jgi:hypothetical protein